MLTLLTTLGGAIFGLLPELIKIFKDKQDKKHELALMDKQIEQYKVIGSQRIDEINATADIAESTAIYKTFYSGIKWVDAYISTVRPTVTYACFALFAFVKGYTLYQVLSYLGANDAPLFAIKDTLAMLWSDEDTAMLGGILGFWFGSRAMSKGMRGK